jgi:hypothetical protein
MPAAGVEDESKQKASARGASAVGANGGLHGPANADLIAKLRSS